MAGHQAAHPVCRRADARRRRRRQGGDFLATTEIWEKLLDHFGVAAPRPGDDLYFDPAWEEILRRLEIDCRVMSYDQFANPPEGALPYAGEVEWWRVRSRSTPARMWRLNVGDNKAYDIFGRLFRNQKSGSSEYEENVAVLGDAESVDDLRKHPWPEPDWWDFSGMGDALAALHRGGGAPHVRYRMGAVFEIVWQLRGMDKFTVGMEPAKLKREHGDRLSFHGGIDIIDLLPKGTPEAVRSAVRDIASVLGAGGGYIMASSHHIQPDTPLENILAMYALDLR